MLIVDDESVILEMLTRLLEEKGYSVRKAASAEAALAALEREPVDLILLDNVLPGMTGMRSLAEIRRRSSAPVIMMTGHYDEEFCRDALILGASDVLTKPIDQQALCATLEKASAAAAD
jgi:DNA-binding response OmpR family regulator